MPKTKRVRHHSNSSNAPKDDATAVLVKKKVVNTYSRAFPRQVVDKHHFLTPDTPAVEEMELPSHMFQKNNGSVTSSLSQCNSVKSKESSTCSNTDASQASLNMEAAQQQAASNKALSKMPKMDLPKSKRTRKTVQSKGQRKRKAAKKQTRRRENEDTSLKIAVNSASSSEKDDVSAGVQSHTDPELSSRTQTQPHRDPQVSSTVQPQTDPQVAARIQPHTDPQVTSSVQLQTDQQVACSVQPHTDPQVTSSVQLQTDQQVACSVQPHTDPQVACTVQPQTDPQVAARIQPHTEVVTSGYAGQISHSCNLDPVSMEMTCETTVDKASMQPHPIWSRTCNEVLIQQNLQSTAKKVKFFVETIAAEMKHTEPPNTDTGLEVQEASSSNTQKSTTVSGSETLQGSGDESEIETARVRDTCDGQIPVTVPEYFEKPEAPLRFSVLDRQSDDSSGEDAIALLESFPQKSKRLSIDLNGLCGGLTTLTPSRSSPGSRTLNNKSANLKESETKSQAEEGDPLLSLKTSVVSSGGSTNVSSTKNGGSSRGGKVPASNSSLEDHFNKLQMTPIQGPVTPAIDSGNLSAKSAAPLTSTPVTLNSSCGTPAKNLCGLVNFERTPDLNAPTTTAPFLNHYYSDYPLTSTPIYSLPTNSHAVRPGRNTRRAVTFSSVGSTMEKLLEFDEVGFQASDVLDVTESAPKATSEQLPTHNSFGFSSVFSKTASQTDNHNSIHQALLSNTQTKLHSQSDSKVKAFLKRAKSRRLQSKSLTTAAKRSRKNSRHKSLPRHTKGKNHVAPRGQRQLHKRTHDKGTPTYNNIVASTSEENDMRPTGSKDYPVCILIRMSHEAAQHRYHSLSCDDKSIPEDILTQ